MLAVHRHTELVVPPLNPLLRRIYPSGGLRNLVLSNLWSGALYFQFLFSSSLSRLVNGNHKIKKNLLPYNIIVIMYCFDYLELQRPKAGVFWEAAFGSLHLERRAQKGWPCSLHPSYLSFQHCDTPCNDDSFGHLQQDEYHMLHLVCASRTPPSSPKPPRSLGNKPQETSTGPAVSPSLAFLLISSVAALLSSPTSLLKHTHAHLPEVCGLICELRSKL